MNLPPLQTTPLRVFSKETLAEFVGRPSFNMLFYLLDFCFTFLLSRSFNVQLLSRFVVLNSSYTRSHTVSWGISTYINLSS